MSDQALNLYDMDRAVLERLRLVEEVRKLQADADSAETKAAKEWENFQHNASRPALNHIYPFFDYVDDQSVANCMLTFDAWHRRQPIDVPFTIIFNSGGGSVIDGFALFDAIEAMKDQGRKVITVGRGYVASMAGILLQAGTERVLGPRATLLIHEISASAEGKSSSLRDMQKFVDNLSRDGFSILAERSTLTAEQIAERCDRRDWYLASQEAIELGFADRIG